MCKLKDATVLVVDDEPDLRDMVAFEFRLQGSTVLAAGDGRDALGIVESQKVDAVITDIRMSECDGIALLDAIRTRDPQDPVVIFITAYDCDLAPFEAYDMGAEGIFSKPFSLKDLVDNVEKALVPPEERWFAAPAVQPTRMIERHFPDLDAARIERLLELGRGGMAIAFTDDCPAPGENVAFRLTLAGGPVPIIEGAGCVRWAQHAPTTYACRCGIEFEHLTEPSRTAFLQWMIAAHCIPFIPRL